MTGFPEDREMPAAEFVAAYVKDLECWGEAIVIEVEKGDYERLLRLAQLGARVDPLVKADEKLISVRVLVDRPGGQRYAISEMHEWEEPDAIKELAREAFEDPHRLDFEQWWAERDAG